MLKGNDEVWRDMVGHEGQYQVSNLGRIRSIKTNHGRPTTLIKATYIRSESCQYLYTSLSVRGKTTPMAVHRAVAMAFIDNPESKPMVNHLNGDKRDNRACNLEWVTCRENHRHAVAAGLRSMDHVMKANIGSKRNAKSKHHNVTWDAARGKWKGSVKHNRKVLEQKRFATEEEAARHVNWIIDHYNLNRPKNVIT